MSSTTIFLFCLSFIMGVLYYYVRIANKTESEFAEEYSIFSGMIYTIKNFFGWIEPVESVDEFQEWATNVNLPRVPRQSFKKWADSLELQEAVNLTQQVSAFSSGLNIDLAWLTSEQLDSHPQLKQGVSEIIAFYCLANFKASQISDDIKAMVAFQTWQDNPNSKEQQEFGRTLLANLMEKALIAPMSPDLLLASEQERQEYAIGSILLAAEENPEEFHTVLKTLVVPPQQEEPTPQAEPEPAAA